MSRARLHRLRLPVPVHDRWRGALVPKPRRAAGGGRQRRHGADPSPVGARRRAGGSGRPHRRRGPQDEALRSQRATASAAPDRLRPGSARPSPPSRSTLRHRAHGVVPVFLAPGHSRDTQAEQIPDRRRLARSLDPRLLARVPRALRRPDRLVDSVACAFACRSVPSASRSCTSAACASKGSAPS